MCWRRLWATTTPNFSSKSEEHLKKDLNPSEYAVKHILLLLSESSVASVYWFTRRFANTNESTLKRWASKINDPQKSEESEAFLRTTLTSLESLVKRSPPRRKSKIKYSFPSVWNATNTHIPLKCKQKTVPCRELSRSADTIRLLTSAGRCGNTRQLTVVQFDNKRVVDVCQDVSLHLGSHTISNCRMGEEKKGSFIIWK